MLKEPKKCRLFRVTGCSLYRDLFAAKVYWGTELRVQTGGVHSLEVFSNRGFTVY